MQKTLVIITGPTGIGKTKTGIDIALHFNTDIISADSRQIYREMQIGTAVPDKHDRKGIKHYLIQNHSIKDILALLEKLFLKHDIVVMVGGSMLYIDAVCYGIDTMPDVDPEIRNELKKRYSKDGIGPLRLQLKQLDPDYYLKVDLRNPNRIVHALEVCLTTGRPFSKFRLNDKKQRFFEILKIGLNCERKLLYENINARVDKMIEDGLEKEARLLYPQKHLNALNTVGYREMFHYFDGQITREKAIELIKRNTRRYARKQLTWHRNDPKMNWFQPTESTEIINFIENNRHL